MSLKSSKKWLMFSVGMAYPPPQRKCEAIFHENPVWATRPTCTTLPMGLHGYPPTASKGVWVFGVAVELCD